MSSSDNDSAKRNAKPPARQRAAGSHAAAKTPVVNPRVPAVPASLDLSLEQYYAACALVGLLGSQATEPDQEWAAEWACCMGELMAKKCRKKWHHR